MEPLSPNDPVLRLLRSGKDVEPRPNFTQNVLRAVRLLPQEAGMRERLAEWFSGPLLPRLAAFGAAAVLVLGTAFFLNFPQQDPSGPVAATLRREAPPLSAPVVDEMLLSATEEPVVTMIAGERDDMDPLGVLLVHEDTSALTVAELALLLY